MKTLIIDNYDSFTFNLFQYVAELGGKPVVYKNDAISVEDIHALAPTHIILSPGPGTVEDSADFGVCSAVLAEFPDTPVLGVCLGHQGIIYHCGGKIVRAPKIMHGKTSSIVHTDDGIFSGVENPFSAMRYHSLIGDRACIPACLKITAETADDHLVMGVQHRERPLFGVQFHPESIRTLEGKKILRNFLRYP